MAIQKMKLVSVVGPVQDFDRIVSEYLLRFDIHVENVLSVLDHVKGLLPYPDENKYNEPIAKIEEFYEMAGQQLSETNLSPVERSAFSDSEILEEIAAVEQEFAENRAALVDIQAKLDANSQVIKQLEHMLELEINLDDLFKFSFIKFRFGRLPKAGYKKLQAYLQDIDAFFVEGEVEKDYVYGVYFMPAAYEEKIDGIFTSLYFERIIVSGDSHGTPKAAYESFQEERLRLLEEVHILQSESKQILEKHSQKLLNIYALLQELSQAASIRKVSAHTRESFYVVGWVAERDVKKIIKSLDVEPNVVLVEEEPNIIRQSAPPIRLRNWAIFRPFEMFVRMYGLPDYNEIDPTPLLAVTYALMFGIMFGDAGHGIVLLLGGFLFYKLKKMDLGAIVSCAGFCSILFGLLYGSVFGNETLLRSWRVTKNLAIIEPMQEINTILIAAVAAGVVIILISMFVNIINAVKSKDWGRMLFDQNGLAGVVFYISVLLLAGNMLLGFGLPSLPIILGGIVLPLLLVFLKEPLSGLLAGKENWRPQRIGEFILESFFELFEIVLSFGTNTISFVRLGAFALGHASMMSVVYILADMVPGAALYWVVMVLGNLLVIGMEGLVVGIQSLRLEFYEMFSRYYSGQGREFRSIKSRQLLKLK